VLLSVIARAMAGASRSRRQQKDLLKNMEQLREDPKATIVAEDIENMTPSQLEE